MTNRLLIDSHILLWLPYKSGKIGVKATQIVTNASAVYVSANTLWELCIKHKNGKLRFGPDDLSRSINDLGIELLLCTPNHIEVYGAVELPHENPFDTMLIAQTVAENMPLLTADKLLLDSPYPTIDARI